MIIKYYIYLILSVAIFMGCASDRQEQSSQEQFFSLLQDLCGEEFEGDTVFPDDPEHDFYDAELYMKIESCTDNEIRIPFYVNDDRSRTWVITRTDQGLLLKHDHRDPETGIEHDLTQYGGYSNVHGAANVQYFEADDETAEMLPEASTNVWMLEVNPEEGKFVYYLERHDQPRYRAEFRLKKRE